MAKPNVTPIPAEDLPSNNVERLLGATLGKNWLKDCMRKLSPEQLEGARSLATDTAEQTILRIKAVGRALGNAEDCAMEKDEVRHIGWTIAHLADFADVSMIMAMMAKELSYPAGRAWQLDGKFLDDAA